MFHGYYYDFIFSKNCNLDNILFYEKAEALLNPTVSILTQGEGDGWCMRTPLYFSKRCQPF